MDGNSAPIEVVGAIILNEKHEVLCALRSQTMSQPGHWEFPGGKIDPRESPQAALVREIEEELGCGIEVGDLAVDCTYAYPNVTIRLRTFFATLAGGRACATEHEKLEWVPIRELAALRWAPADIPTVEYLRTWQPPEGAL